MVLKLMIAFRKHHPNVRCEHFFTRKPNENGMKDINWHSARLFFLDWDDSDSHVLAFTIWGLAQDNDIRVMFNMGDCGLDFEVPALEGKRWFKVIDTAVSSPLDIIEQGKETGVVNSRCHVSKHSVVVLISML